MNRVKDKVIIITGGNSGVGATAAKLLASEGGKIVISARRLPQLEDIAKQIQDDGGEVLAVQTDISKKEDVANLFKTAIDKFGKVDAVVNNAGVLEGKLLAIDKFDDDELDKILNINTKGTLYCMREATKVLPSGGSIVNVASVAGVMGNGGAAYVSSKAAILGATRHTAMTFASKKIRCNAICPGSIITPMTMSLGTDSLDPDIKDAMVRHNDMTVDICRAEDVANIILFFVSDESRAITGQNIVCDFGSTL